MRASLWMGGALLFALGCDRADNVRCRLLPGPQVARSQAASFDAIALATYDKRVLAAWSDASGVWLKWLDLPSAKAVRLDLARARGPAHADARCSGGMALALDRDEAWLGCLTQGLDAQPGALSLHQRMGRALTPGLDHVVSEVGRDARGVALLLGAAPKQVQPRDLDPRTLSVTWSDGALGDPNVLLRDFPARSTAGPEAPRSMSQPHANAHSPTLLLHDGVLWAAWTESDLTPGHVRQRLMLKRGEHAPTLLADVLAENANPVLARDAQGVVLAYRAARRVGARPELWVARLDANGRLSQPAHALGRANSLGGPSLALCEHTRAALVPLDHAGELYIAFHPLSAALRGTEENHQYYENGRELVTVASVCVGGYPLALMAEQTDSARPGARLLTATFRCSE